MVFPDSLDTDIGVHQITVQQGDVSNSLTFTVYRPQPGPDLMTSMPGYFVGQVTGGAAVADVNGDGRSDVIISGPNSYTGSHISLTVLYGSIRQRLAQRDLALLTAPEQLRLGSRQTVARTPTRSAAGR